MKIVLFTTYYEPYLDSFYKKNTELKNKSYQEQLDALIDDAFGAFCSYLPELRTQGHEVHLIISNAKALQVAWANENGIQFKEDSWQFDIPIKQTQKVQPDVFYLASVFQYYGDFLTRIKEHSAKVFGWISCPFPLSIFNNVHPELILTSAPHYLDEFRNRGINAEPLNAFFDENIFYKIHEQNGSLVIKPSLFDFTFLGGVTLAHKNRIDAINKLVQKTKIQLFGYGFNHFPDTRNRLLRKLLTHPVKKRYNGEVWGLDMYRILYQSKITFNSHIDMANGVGVNMRMYEATGMGTLLLTDGKGKNELFEDGKEVVYYENISDAIEKLNYYLDPNNDDQRLKIAQAGQKRTLENYNVKKTVTQLISYFNYYLQK